MEWKVRYIDYPKQFKNMKKEITGVILNTLSRGDLILRQQLKEFEENLAAFVGTKYAVGVANCTDALMLCLQAAGIGAGDEVITVSHTFVATVEVIHHLGAKPVLIDISDDHNMNVNLMERAITKKTKAIIPVHLNGRLCDMEKLMATANRHKLIVIEDSAQALGASLNGIKGGAYGLAGCFSFYPAKLLGAFGDAGAVVTNDKEIADKIKLLRNHGRADSGEIVCWGWNSRLDNLQGALLNLKLKYLPVWINRRREIAKIYHEALKDIRQLHLPPPPQTGDKFYDVFQNYEIEAENRDLLVNHLNQKGIEVMLSWGGKGVHQFKALGLNHINLLRTESMFSKVLMLPMYPELVDEQVRYVAKNIKEFYS